MIYLVIVGCPLHDYLIFNSYYSYKEFTLLLSSDMVWFSIL